MPENTDNFIKTVNAARKFVLNRYPESLAVSDPYLPDADKKATITGIIESYDGYYAVRAEINADTEEVIFYAFPGVFVLSENTKQIEALIKEVEDFDIKNFGIQTLEIKGGWLCSKQVKSFKERCLSESDYYKFLENAVNYIFHFKDYFLKVACGMDCKEPIGEHIFIMNKKLIEDTKRVIAEMLGCDPESLEDFGVIDSVERIENDKDNSGDSDDDNDSF